MIAITPEAAERRTLQPFIYQELRGKYVPPPPSLEHLSKDEVEQLLLAEANTSAPSVTRVSLNRMQSTPTTSGESAARRSSIGR